ncbi:MAG: S8 family serine peptidase [Oscillochloridaceae bacterium umkhey_bin13]
MRYRPLTRTLFVLLGLLILGTPSLFARTPEPTVQIQLQGFRFDPLRAEPQLAATQRSATLASDQPDLYLVQFRGPIEEPWKAALQAVGARLYDYIPDYAFIARMNASTADQVRRLPAVRWVGAYHPAYRLDPSLRDPILAATEPQVLTIQTLPDADPATVQASLNALGITIEAQSANALATSWRAQLTPAQIEAVAKLPEVLWIEPFFAPKRLDERAAVGIMRTDVLRAQLGLYGAGQIVGIADSGLDTGDPNRIHPDFAGRLIKAYCLGRPQPCDWSDVDGHGTHVAGSVLASGVTSGSNPANRQYNNSFAGTAPEARMVFQSTGDAMGGLGGIPQDNGQLMRQAYADGAGSGRPAPDLGA